MKKQLSTLAASALALSQLWACAPQSPLVGPAFRPGMATRGPAQFSRLNSSASKALFEPAGQLRKYARTQQESEMKALRFRRQNAAASLNPNDPPAPELLPPAPASANASIPTEFGDLQWFLRKINAPNAWKVTEGHPELTVAVIDSGVDYGHAAFSGRMLKGFDFADLDMDPMDQSSHGTHVAGIIAGRDSNIRGVAPNVKIMAVKVFPDGDSAQGDRSVSRAIRYATRYGASVINLSLGVPSLYDCGTYSGFMRDLNSAIDEAVANGVTVVTAMGNQGYGFVHGRCSVQQNVNQIPVVATNEMDQLSSFSNYPNLNHPKAVSAPGVNIFSTVPRHISQNYNGSPYDYMDGTSMAAPVVAGAIALIRSAMYEDYVRVMEKYQSPALSFREFFHSKAQVASQQMSMGLKPGEMAEQILFSHTNNPSHVNPPAMIYEGSRQPLFGYGRIDVGRAVAAASQVFSATN